MARRLNRDGDGQGELAGHGGEQRDVMVYQVESYDFWWHYLGRSDLTWGAFGETSPLPACPTKRCASVTGTASVTPNSR